MPRPAAHDRTGPATVADFFRERTARRAHQAARSPAAARVTAPCPVHDPAAFWEHQVHRGTAGRKELGIARARHRHGLREDLISLGASVRCVLAFTMLSTLLGIAWQVTTRTPHVDPAVPEPLREWDAVLSEPGVILALRAIVWALGAHVLLDAWRSWSTRRTQTAGILRMVPYATAGLLLVILDRYWASLAACLGV